MLRRRTVTIILAVSLGLNIGLGGIMIYRTARDSSVQREARQDFERRRSEWSSRERAHADTTRPFPRLERQQVRTLIEMRREAEKDIEPLRQQVRMIHRSIQEELLSESISGARLDSLVGLTGTYQQRIQARLVRLIQDEREILSPQQYEWIVRRMVPGPGRLGEDERWDRDRRGKLSPPAGSTPPPPRAPLR